MVGSQLIFLCVTLTNRMPESQGTTNSNVIMRYKWKFKVGTCIVTGRRHMLHATGAVALDLVPSSEFGP